MKNARPLMHGGKSIDYDAVSRVYDQVREGDSEMVGHMLEGITLGENPIVLDVGCGTGNNTILVLRALSSRVIGIDISAGMLEKARAKAPALELVKATADDLPFSPSLFDFVFMTEVIHHLSDFKAALREMFRVLRPGSSSCIVTQSHKQIQNRMTSRFFPGSATVDKKRYPDIGKIEAAMKGVGFARVSSRQYSFTPVVLGPDYLQTVEMRGYSMLHKISEKEYEEGLKALRTAFEAGEKLTYSAGYTFVRGCKR
jgi:ubiquinone/menaquinone biosynthesis C-methylase UbiE